MTTLAGLNRFARVITTKRSGKCHFCEAATTADVDVAAVNGSGKWVAICNTCATSIGTQVAGVCISIERKAEGHAVNVVLPDPDAIMAAIQGGASEAAAYDILVKLLAVRDAIGEQVVSGDPMLAKLDNVAGNAAATPRDRDFAASLAAGLRRYGKLTERQEPHAIRLVEKYGGDGGAVTVSHVDPSTLDVGLYTVGDDIWWVREGRKSGNTYAMRLASEPVEGSKLDWEYVKGGLRILAGLNASKDDGTVAARLGHVAHHCCFCGIPLTDDGDNRSVKVGYGPVCAQRYALPWG